MNVVLPELGIRIPTKEARVNFEDNLLVGPSRRSLHEQHAARLTYWTGYEPRVAAMYSKLERMLLRTNDVTIWAGDDANSRLCTAFVCAQMPVTASVRLHVVAPAQAGTRAPTAAARVPEHVDAVDLGRRWNEFASNSPSAVLRAVSGLAREPEVPMLLESLFPRQSGSRMALSRFDAVILSSATEPISPAATIHPRKPELRLLERMAFWFGDFFIANRLLAWSEGELRTRALHRQIRDPKAPLFRSTYTLSEAGKELLASVDDLSSVPPISIGGATAYDPVSPFFARSYSNDSA